MTQKSKKLKQSGEDLLEVLELILSILIDGGIEDRGQQETLHWHRWQASEGGEWSTWLTRISREGM